MNKKQLIALWIGIAVVVLMVVCPPWARVWRNGNVRLESPSGYGFIFWPPDAGALTVDITRLTLQWFAVAVVTGAAIWTLKDRKE